LHGGPGLRDRSPSCPKPQTYSVVQTSTL
jgi:hypothetical protein